MCAILGGILLLLCCILAAFFVYAQFKKHCGRSARNRRRPSSGVFHLSSHAGHYTVVPTANPEVEAATRNGIGPKGDDEEELGRRLISDDSPNDRAVRIVPAGTKCRKPQVRKYRK